MATESKYAEVKEHGKKYTPAMDKGECEDCSKSKKKGMKKCAKCGKKC